MRIDLFDESESYSQELYSLVNYKLTSYKLIGRTKLSQETQLLKTNFNKVFYKRFLEALDDHTRETFKKCDICLYLWSQPYFLRIYCFDLETFNYMKKRKKWIAAIERSIYNLVGCISKIEVVYKEDEKIYVFFRKIVSGKEDSQGKQ